LISAIPQFTFQSAAFGRSEARAIAEAEAEIDAGKGVPHKKVRQWLRKLARGKITPPPCK